MHGSIPRLTCLVSDSDDLTLLPRLAAAGVDGFQVRTKTCAVPQLVELVRAVIGAVRPSGAAVTVNDRVDVALATGADGVHLGPSDLSVELARQLAPDLVIGATCRSLAAVEAAAAAGADYAGVGPVFATSSKEGLPDPIGVDGLRAATGRLPVVAIGGITAVEAPGLIAAGAAGIAVIGGLWRQRDPVRAATEFVTAIG